MNQVELNNILNDLIENWEDEVTEFKQAKHDYSTSDIGKYFSALANEANLREVPKGWLVFGINNKTRNI
ncbi:MAG: ATP-binding protein, partial [Arcobacteraceae bacterium]|nr:ATP-binding protein [Arcobacteraceae bacterium]